MPNKYGAEKCICDGFEFDSLLEYDCYLILKDLHDKGVIKTLELQHEFELRSQSGKVIGKYVADFVATFANDSQKVIEAKGVKTATWRWKEKHFRQDYPGIPLLVVKREDINELLFLDDQVIAK